MAFTGFTANTAKKLLLDAGAFVKNFEPGTDTWETVKATKVIGATQGGGSFSAVPTVRRVEIDGVKGAAKGLEALDEWVVTITANVKEISADAIALALASSTSAPTEAAPEGYTKITANNEIKLDDYLDNITWIGKLSGSDKPVIIVVKNALNTNGLSLTMADKAEGLISLTFTGHYDTDNLDSPPFEIYYPEVE